MRTKQLLIHDSRGIVHEAIFTSSRSESAGLVLMIGGVPLGAHNQTGSPFDFHPFFKFCAQQLARRGISSLAMNTAGMGQSSGLTEEETLQSRISSWTDAVNYLVDKKLFGQPRVSLIGSSMGAHIALRLLAKLSDKKVDVDRLVLVSPAAYPENSELAKFKDEFTKLIRADWPLPSSPAFEALKNFDGQTMLIYPEGEEVIPKPVQELFQEVSSKAGGKVLQPLGVSHGLKQDGKHHLPTMKSLARQVADFLATGG